MEITWKELIVDLADHNPDDLLSEWRWFLDDSYHVVLISSLGDMFLTDSLGHVLWLDAGAGKLTEIAKSIEEFQQLRQQSTNADEWFIPQLVGDIMQSGARLTPGQCFGYKLAPVVGGQLKPTNFEPTDLSVHFSILGQLSRQARDLPEGTPIRSFVTAEPNAD